MLERVVSMVERLRHSTVAIPAAIVVAALMIGVNEMAYHGALSRLQLLVQRGQARLLLLQAVQHTTDAESGKRGYLLTRGPEYLKPYLEAKREVVTDLQELQRRYAGVGDADARQRVGEIETTVTAKLSEMEEVLRLYDGGRADAALDIVRSGIGRDLMSKMHTQSDALIAAQSRRIERDLSDVYDTLLLNRVGIGTMTFVALLALVMFVRLGRQLDLQREERQAAVQAERDRLEEEVQRRTTELTELARHLQTAREDERARLARDLHDEMGALLTAAKLDVARIKPRLQQLGAAELLERLKHLTETLNSGIALKRRIIEDLRPSTLSSLGLVPALEILCSEFADRSGLKVEADLHPVPLSASADLTVFRVVQEALTNVAKYAAARHVQVGLRLVDGRAEVSVADDGRGFDPAQSQAGSHGLMGMRFRVEAERGQFQLVSRPGAGTRVGARLPLAPQADAPAVIAG